MKIQTFSIVIGTSACDAHCPYCVSHTTGFEELQQNPRSNEQNFFKAARLAALGGCTTVLMTGKGEPTLFPNEITNYLELLHSLEPNDFPFIELQTNAIRLGYLAKYWADHGKVDGGVNDQFKELYCELVRWRDLGLNTIAISAVDVDSTWNDKIYLHHRDIGYPDLSTTVRFLHELGFTTRLCIMMHRRIVDDWPAVRNIIDWCRNNNVAQLTVRPIRKPTKGAEGSVDYMSYIAEFGLTDAVMESVVNQVSTHGTHILTLMNGAHKAKVYDVDGQNVCVSDCLTVEPATDDIRTLIYYADGRLTYDWQYKGARLL